MGVNKITSIITVDTTSVVIKTLWDGNTASNRSSLVYLLHHVLLPGNHVVLVNSIDAVLVRDEASLTRVAVTAHLHWIASLAIVKATSHVDRASLVSDLVVGHPLEGSNVISTVATVVGSLARDEHLRGDVDIGPRSLPGDLDSVGKGRCGGVGPARATVGRDVLVAHVSKVVDSINHSPVPS